ncbi:hypothetical protein LCI18_011881 [Fusarium solani-melongenae]|uniref:Uncharacterized protein n=1 Tax=Fusarium solani subsp. cucurbitae TaxID=2747967 RepID=A0ACD3ZIC9_FUSSC|nr:hypothetical protein LCI18_011881 [Fusarium solani-melongenae]
MAPDPAPPLPLAANRAALSNRISLLLASQSSVLKTMNLGKPAAAPTTKRRAIPENDNDDDDLGRGSRPNEGVGYVPDKKDAQKIGNSKEERMLRGRLLGRDGKVVKKGKVEESESEDDVGRSALGKRKRPRREAEPETEQEAEPAENVEEKIVEVDGDVSMKDDHVKVGDEAQAVTQSDQGADKKRKKKNKKKKKQKVKNGEEK